MITNLTLTPSYGVVYDEAHEVLTAWYEGKDFKIVGGPYTSVRDVDKLRDMGYETLWLRYDVHGEFRAVEICL